MVFYMRLKSCFTGKPTHLVAKFRDKRVDEVSRESTEQEPSTVAEVDKRDKFYLVVISALFLGTQKPLLGLNLPHTLVFGQI